MAFNAIKGFLGNSFRVEAEISQIESKLNNPSYTANAPEHAAKRIKDYLRKKLVKLYAERAKLYKALEQKESDPTVTAMFYAESNGRVTKKDCKVPKDHLHGPKGGRKLTRKESLTKGKGPSVPNQAYKVDRSNVVIPGTDNERRRYAATKFQRRERSHHFRTRHSPYKNKP